MFADRSRECRFWSVKGPASRIACPEKDSQFPIELVFTYRNCRNRF